MFRILIVCFIVFVIIYYACFEIPLSIIPEQKRKKRDLEKQTKDNERTIKIKNSEAYKHTLKMCQKQITTRLKKFEEDSLTKKPSELLNNGYSLTIQIGNTIQIRDNYLQYTTVNGKPIETIHLSDFYVSLDFESVRLFWLALYKDLKDYYKNLGDKLEIRSNAPSDQEYYIHINFSKFLVNKIEVL